MAARRRLLLTCLLLATLLLSARALQLQVIQHQSWRARAEAQQGGQTILPAPRGTIYDRDGIPLAASDEVFRIGIAPREVRDGAKLVKALQKHAGLSRSAAQRAVDRRKIWAVLPGRFGPGTRVGLNGIRGVYFERTLRRFYPRGLIASELIGAVTLDGKALSGLELELDSLLRGQPGSALTRRDARGRALPGALQEVVAPVAGQDVFLTIDADLQEIAREALLNAIQQTRSAGGEIIMADPRTGEILAAVSSKEGGRSWRAATEPYEPGSTLKPFAIATLLAEKRARLDDTVFAENGVYTRDQRTITDVHGYGWLTVAQALQHSSNVALAKLSDRLDAKTQYAYLRAFGFGARTAVSYPSESAGLLRRPASWSKYSAASLAIGYEISVTPLQLLFAYGALANGGMLMQAQLVRQVRDRTGGLTTFEGRAVRRAIPERIAEQLRPVLADVVADGTARAAALGPFTIAGKTGTSRSFIDGRYRRGEYASTFAGFFPVKDPQLVLLVKLDSPRGAYYGGLTAAPVTRAALEAALAALNTPLDKRAVASDAPPPLPVAATLQVAAGEEIGAHPVFIALEAAPTGQLPPFEEVSAQLPNVTGLPLRDAVRQLHAAGFRVRVYGTGAVAAMDPAPGVLLKKRALIRVGGAEAGS